MSTMILAFFIMLVIMAAMAIGVLFGRAPIAGSCGGMKALGLDVECEICGGNPDLCDAGSIDQERPKTSTKVDTNLTKNVGR